MFWASGHCTACAACGAASPAESSDSRRWAAWAGVSFLSQLVGSLVGAGYALAAGAVAYGVVKIAVGIRLTEEEEDQGADLAIHNIGAYPEEEFIKR